MENWCTNEDFEYPEEMYLAENKEGKTVFLFVKDNIIYEKDAVTGDVWSGHDLGVITNAIFLENGSNSHEMELSFDSRVRNKKEARYSFENQQSFDLFKNQFVQPAMTKKQNEITSKAKSCSNQQCLNVYNVKSEIICYESRIKKLVAAVSLLIKQNIDLNLQIEKEQSNHMKDIKQFHFIESEMEKASRDLEDDKTKKVIEVKLKQAQEINQKLRNELNEVNSSIEKVQVINRIETNRAKCFERRIEALEKKANSLAYKKQELISRIRRSTINSPD